MGDMGRVYWDWNNPRTNRLPFLPPGIYPGRWKLEGRFDYGRPEIFERVVLGDGDHDENGEVVGVLGPYAFVRLPEREQARLEYEREYGTK